MLSVLNLVWKLILFKTFRSHVTELPTTTSASGPFFPPFVPERDRGRGRRPPPPRPPPQQPTTETTIDVEESIVPTESDIPTTQKNAVQQSVTKESMDVNTQDSAEQSTAGEMTDPMPETTIEPIVIKPESDSDTDYKEFMPDKIPDYLSPDDYKDFLPDNGNKR